MADTVDLGTGRRSLESFFHPASVAVIGATEQIESAGRIVLENLLLSQAERRIYAVNPNRQTVLDQKCYPHITDLPETPDLAVIVTPADTVPGIVEECGSIGTRTVIIISAGFKEVGAEGIAREKEITATIKKHQMRIIGPNCMGVILPRNNLNTTFIPKMPKPGYVAFLSQSGALGAGILDWAIRTNMGFSAFVSLGSMMDVDFGDAIDYFGEDPDTRSIIIYPESLGDVKKFMSAARGFARSKPIIVLKPGKFEESARAALSHTGAMVGEDAHYDAIFRRAGVIRVDEMRDLFNCAYVLDSARLPQGPNVAIITNGGGPAVLAIDNLIGQGGKLATLNEKTVKALNAILPANWSHANPIDIREDADVQRYIGALEITLKDAAVNGLLVIYTPQGKAKSADIAPIIIEQMAKTSKPIIPVFIGSDNVADARQLLYDARVPAFEFPEDAVKTYMHMWQYASNLEMLYQTPEESPLAGASRNHLKTIINKANRANRTLLSQEDAARFLSTYRIPTVMPRLATTEEEAVSLASHIGYPVVMKVCSRDIIHKSDVNGVVCGVAEADVKTTFNTILKNARKYQPEARIDGVSIQQFITDYDYEIIIGAKKDPTCGPVIMFGLGGSDTEFFRDFAVGLPPLNQTLALRVIEQTRIYELLIKGYRNHRPLDIHQLTNILVKVSDLMVDFPEIQELDINPVAVASDMAMALDTRLILDLEAVRTEIPEYGHLIISPYPTRYITPWQTKDGRAVILRPIKPDDETMEKRAMESLSEESRRLRFFASHFKVTHEMLIRFCNIDYDREMTIIAEYTENGEKRSVGNSRLMIQADGLTGEFAVVVADDFHGAGLGLKLVDMVIGIGREKGLETIYGIALSDNTGMINLAKRLGFTVNKYTEDEVKLNLEL